MPEIPQFIPRQEIPAVPDTARANPAALAAPGRAAAAAGEQEERLGQSLEGVGEAFGRLQERQDADYAATNAAAATIGAHDSLQNAIDAARKSGNYDGFARTQTAALDQDLQPRLAAAPSPAAADRVRQHFAGLRNEIATRASAFEHEMASQDHYAKRVSAADQLASTVYRDPTMLRSTLAQSEDRLQQDIGLGLVNPEQAQKERTAYRSTLAEAAFAGHLRDNPTEAAADLESGRYDAYLTPAQIERLQPKIDEAKAHMLAGGAAAAAGPQPNATDDEIDRALAPIIPRESGAKAYVGAGGADLSNTPLDQTGFPAWAGIPARRPQDAARGLREYSAGLYQITRDNWHAIAPSLGITDFSPESQRLVAHELYRRYGMAPWAATSGGSGVASSAAAASAPADLDGRIAAIGAAPGYTDRQKELAIGIATRQHAEWSRATAGERAQLVQSTRDGVAMLATGADWQPDTAAIKRLLPPQQADQTLRAIDEARDEGQARNAIQWSTPDELAEQVARVHQRLQNPQDFERSQRYAAQFDKAMTARAKTLADDPAQYVEAAPEVSEAKAAIDKNNPGPGIQQAAQLSLALQQHLGLPPDQQHVLTKTEAAHEVTAMTKADPATTDLGAQLDATAKVYGPYWHKAFGDLVKAGLPPEYQVLGAMDTPAQAAARTDFQRMLTLSAEKGGAEQLKKAAPAAAVQQIGQGIDDTLAEFRATVRDPQLYDAVKSGVQRLAEYYAFQGKNGDQALTLAYDGVIGRKYDFDGPIRAPKGELGTVERAGAAVLGKLTADQLPDINAGDRQNPEDKAGRWYGTQGPSGADLLTPDERRGVYLSAVENGEWRVNPDETGLVRMARFRDGTMIPAKRADGTPIMVPFADAATLAQGQMPAAPPPAVGTP